MPGPTVRAVLVTLTFGLSLGIAPAGADDVGPRAPAKGPFKAAYDIYVGGLGVGELTIDANVTAKKYRAEATFRTTGLIGFFLEKNWIGRIEGVVMEDRLVPERYLALQPDEEDGDRREVTFARGDPVSVSFNTPPEQQPWSIEAAEQAPAADPITALFSMLAPGQPEALCDWRTEIFDGKHRFAFEIGQPEREGDEMRCPGEHIRLAGYEPDMMGEDARQAFTLYLSKREDGLFQATRLDADTGFGTGVMSLRE